MSEKTSKKMSFEQSLEKLEQIVTQIESGEVPLEESIEKYAQGVKLVEQCRKILDKAEQKIQLLSKKQSQAGETLEVSGELEKQE